jgi:hypothetical protein
MSDRISCFLYELVLSPGIRSPLPYTSHLAGMTDVCRYTQFSLPTFDATATMDFNYTYISNTRSDPQHHLDKGKLAGVSCISLCMG